MCYVLTIVQFLCGTELAMAVLVPANASELLDLFAVTLRDSLSSSALKAMAEEHGKQLACTQEIH